MLPVAGTWFARVEVEPGIARINEPHVSDLVRGNIWHVRGSDRDLVVDSGLGVAHLRDHQPQLFDHSPLLAVTHHHLDHAGGAWEFDHVAAAVADQFDKPDHGSLRTLALLDQIWPDRPPGDSAVPEWLIDALPHQDYDPSLYRLLPVTITHEVADGDELDIGGRVLTVLHLPGHSPGSIALLDEHDGALFSGDVIYDDLLLDEIVGADIPRYLETMRRLREFPIRIVYPGHGQPFDGPRMREIIDAYIGHRGNCSPTKVRRSPLTPTHTDSPAR